MEEVGGAQRALPSSEAPLWNLEGKQKRKSWKWFQVSDTGKESDRDG